MDKVDKRNNKLYLTGVEYDSPMKRKSSCLLEKFNRSFRINIPDESVRNGKRRSSSFSDKENRLKLKEKLIDFFLDKHPESINIVKLGSIADKTLLINQKTFNKNHEKIKQLRKYLLDLDLEVTNKLTNNLILINSSQYSNTIENKSKEYKQAELDLKTYKYLLKKEQQKQKQLNIYINSISSQVSIINSQHNKLLIQKLQNDFEARKKQKLLNDSRNFMNLFSLKSEIDFDRKTNEYRNTELNLFNLKSFAEIGKKKLDQIKQTKTLIKQEINEVDKSNKYNIILRNSLQIEYLKVMKENAEILEKCDLDNFQFLVDKYQYSLQRNKTHSFDINITTKLLLNLQSEYLILRTNHEQLIIKLSNCKSNHISNKTIQMSAEEEINKIQITKKEISTVLNNISEKRLILSQCLDKMNQIKNTISSQDQLMNNANSKSKLIQRKFNKMISLNKSFQNERSSQGEVKRTSKRSSTVHNRIKKPLLNLTIKKLIEKDSQTSFLENDENSELKNTYYNEFKLMIKLLIYLNFVLNSYKSKVLVKILVEQYKEKETDSQNGEDTESVNLNLSGKRSSYLRKSFFKKLDKISVDDFIRSYKPKEVIIYGLNNYSNLLKFNQLKEVKQVDIENQQNYISDLTNKLQNNLLSQKLKTKYKFIQNIAKGIKNSTSSKDNKSFKYVNEFIGYLNNDNSIFYTKQILSNEINQLLSNKLPYFSNLNVRNSTKLRNSTKSVNSVKSDGKKSAKSNKSKNNKIEKNKKLSHSSDSYNEEQMKDSKIRNKIDIIPKVNKNNKSKKENVLNKEDSFDLKFFDFNLRTKMKTIRTKIINIKENELSNQNLPKSINKTVLKPFIKIELKSKRKELPKRDFSSNTNVNKINNIMFNQSQSKREVSLLNKTIKRPIETINGRKEFIKSIFDSTFLIN